MTSSPPGRDGAAWSEPVLTTLECRGDSEFPPCMNTHTPTARVGRSTSGPATTARVRGKQTALTLVLAAAAGAMTLVTGLAPAVAATLSGTPAADHIVGTRSADRINSFAGHDTVLSKAGPDRVDAGRGADRVEVGYGDDVGQGGPGNDQLFGGPGSDELSGSRAWPSQPGDLLYGGPGRDTVEGHEVHGGDGKDVLRGMIQYGDDGADTHFIENGGHLVFAGAGDDLVDTAVNEVDGRDEIRCGPGDDEVRYFGAVDPEDELHSCETVTVDHAD